MSNPASQRANRQATVFVAISVSLLATMRSASACTLCIGFPEKTATDYVVGADCVALCRPDAGAPFVYFPREFLKGAEARGEIDLLVDTRTRRLLLADPGRFAVLVLDESDGGWRSLGVATDEYLSVLRRIAVFSADWKGARGVERRWRFFLPLFGHDDPSIRELAYLEMGRAPYRVIRRLGRIVRRDAYASLLDDPKYLQWRSLAILLLAQREDSDDRRHVRESYASAKRLQMTTNLAAWAAALIEIDGPRAIAEIDDAYLRSPHRSVEEVDAIVGALSMHGSAAGAKLQDRIIKSYRLLLTHHPRCAPQVAADLTAWGRRDLIKEVAAVADRRQGFSIEQKVVIRRYLRGATITEELALVGD